MSVPHCAWLVLLLLSAPVAGMGLQDAAQQSSAAPQPSAATHGYTVFVGGAVAGREDVTVQTAADGLTITASGRLSGSHDVVINRVQIRYGPDGDAESFELEASVNGGDTALYTSFAGGTAVTKGVDGGERIAQTDTVPQPVVVLPNVFFGGYEALALRLAGAAPGREFSAFIGAGNQAAVRLATVATERIQIGTSTYTVQRYGLSISNARGVAPVNVYTDASGTLLRVSLPEAGVEVVRDDLASSTARTGVYSNPGDEAVNIPAVGFNLGATLTWPAARGSSPLPAVILLAGAAANERDGTVSGVPILGQLAGAVADAGFVAVRYDKRGHGQSGGRAESVTLTDQAEDVLAVVRWLSARRDVNRDRIVLLGHNEGAWAALLAATRERRIAGVVTIASPATTGSERVVEQQRHVLERLNVPPSERVAKIELQTRINAAVVSGRGWDELPTDVRKQADTPWFQSFLTFDPARVLRDVRQPVLMLHGELDDEVPVSHVDRLSELARGGRSRDVAVVTVRGVNHLLTPAITGDVDEYASLPDRAISSDVTTAITGWLAKTVAATR